MKTNHEHLPNKLSDSRILSTERSAKGISSRNRLVVGGGFMGRLDTLSDTQISRGPSMDTDSPMPPSCLRVVATGVSITVALTLLGAVMAQSMR